MNSSADFLASARRTIEIELRAVADLGKRINEDFYRACEQLLVCEGRIVVTGMGKSGHIARKIAATLASTGSPSFFVHPGEASHGDMGMITAKDVVIALSNSGSTAELLTLLPLIKRLGIPLISMTGNPVSPLAEAASVHLDVSVASEACPLDLAPTSSTTVSLVMGDAIAIALLEARGFTAEDFAFSHPGGALGRKLLLKVGDIMHRDERIPRVSLSTSLREALLEITAKGLGMTTVVDEQGALAGVFTDGDLRRTLEQAIDLHSCTIGDRITRSCSTISANMLAAEALALMEEKSITSLVVMDETEQQVAGVVHLHDILKAGVA
jgi:arabinose-5-phosphate isomerase